MDQAGIPFSSQDEHKDVQQIAIDLVRKTVFDRFVEAKATVPQFSVYVVWFTYILGNWKALVSTSIPDGAYYEVTYDKNKGVAYVDSYKKFDNREIAIPATRS